MSAGKASEPITAFQALGWQFMKATLVGFLGLAVVYKHAWVRE